MGDLSTIATDTTPRADRWRVSLDPWPEADTHLLVVEGMDLQVRFADAAAWTILDMHWRGREVGCHSGATGSVLQWEEDTPATLRPQGDGCSRRQTIGTGHGGEVVRRVSVTVDGREIPVVAGGKLVLEAHSGLDGAAARVHKDSIIGPFDHEAVFDFPSAGPGFGVTHRYRANDAMARGHFAGYRYTFMFMMPETYDRYLVLNPDGRMEQAAINPEPGMLLERPFQALACYSPADQTGMVYAYPKPYPGSNHINVRPGKDRKFRANLFQDHYEVGQTSEFTVRIIPFEEMDKQWVETAASLIELATARCFPPAPGREKTATSFPGSSASSAPD